MVEKPIPDRSPEITTGNAVDDGREFNHWFVGDIRHWSEEREEGADLSYFGLRNTKSVEIKWGVHQKGEKRLSGWAPASEKITLSILLQGRFLLRFRIPEDRDREREHTLASVGDYAIWDEQFEHTWTAEEESVILTVRWRNDP